MSSMTGPPASEVHIHCLTLPHLQNDIADLTHLLSAQELQRAALLKSQQARNKFIACRGKLRKIIAKYIDNVPENIELAYGEHGKPFLQKNSEQLRFNLAHSGNLLIVALSTAFEVGVDIEKVEPDIPLKDMARLVLSAQEQIELFSLPDLDCRTTTFYRYWVQKEACLKACGRGFSLPANSFEVPISDGNQIVVCNQAKWDIFDLEVPNGYVAAVSVEHSPTPTCISHFID